MHSLISCWQHATPSHGMQSAQTAHCVAAWIWASACEALCRAARSRARAALAASWALTASSPAASASARLLPALQRVRCLLLRLCQGLLQLLNPGGTASFLFTGHL